VLQTYLLTYVLMCRCQVGGKSVSKRGKTGSLVPRCLGNSMWWQLQLYRCRRRMFYAWIRVGISLD